MSSTIVNYSIILNAMNHTSWRAYFSLSQARSPRVDRLTWWVSHIHLTHLFSFKLAAILWAPRSPTPFEVRSREISDWEASMPSAITAAPSMPTCEQGAWYRHEHNTVIGHQAMRWASYMSERVSEVGELSDSVSGNGYFITEKANSILIAYCCSKQKTVNEQTNKTQKRTKWSAFKAEPREIVLNNKLSTKLT